MNRGALGECKVGHDGTGGRCALCATGYGHAPRLQVYDRRAGDYVSVESGDACTARWATTGARHIEGEICGEPATQKAGDFLLCDHHFSRLIDYAENRALLRHPAQLERQRELYRQQARLDRQIVLAEERARAGSSLVYYLLRESDGLIKIGSTGSPQSRFRSLRGEHRAVRLLATRPGTRDDELALHDKFGDILAEKREWFRPEARLLKHVLRLRSRHEVRREWLPVVETSEIRAMIRAATAAPKPH